jgi:FkbM family methyltransferase
MDGLLKRMSEQLYGSFKEYIIEEKVNCVSFVELIFKHKVKKLDFLKIDTEGYNYQIFSQI